MTGGTARMYRLIRVSGCQKANVASEAQLKKLELFSDFGRFGSLAGRLPVVSRDD
jgi:hypothetical protein